jgi:hypothetical protein
MLEKKKYKTTMCLFEYQYDDRIAAGTSASFECK